MSALVQSLGEFLTLMVQAFNLSSTFPALVFVLLMRAHALFLLPENSPFRAALSLDSPSGIAFAVLLVSILAYLLDAANLKILRLFEGYGLAPYPPFRCLRDQEKAFVDRMISQIDRLQRLGEQLLDAAERTRDRAHKQELVNLAKELADREVRLVRQIENRYPADPEAVLPTPFGNVIRAAELYPGKVFGMDAVVLWPFLVPTLTERNYSQFVLRAKAMMDFVVNMTLLLAVYGVLAAITEFFALGLSTGLAVKLSIVAAVCMLTFDLAIQAAASWGSTVKVAFVLFREDLREALRAHKPHDYNEERQLWDDTSTFLQGQESDEAHELLGRAIFTPASYRVPLRKKEAKS